jgi:hypothetical protein
MINYDNDFYGWTIEQSTLLKSGQWQRIDIDNLIEEVESMGRSEKRALESRMVVLLAHLLKWQYQPNRRGKSWYLTIKGQRANCQDVLKDNPSLKSKLNDIFINAYQKAKIEAAKETDLDETAFPSDCPYSPNQTFDNDFYPDSHV